jgi:hypothetical protein
MSSSSEEQILNINNIHELSDLPCAGVVDVAQLADRNYSDQNWEIHAGNLRRFYLCAASDAEGFHSAACYMQ